MASKVEALVRNFLKTDGEALYLVPGEKIFLVKGTNKMIVGRENLGEDSFRAVAAELVPGAPVEALAATRHRVPFRVDEVSEPVEIQFGRSGNAHAIMICRVKGPDAPDEEPPFVPEPAPEPRSVVVPRVATTSAFAAPVPPPAPLPARATAAVVPLDVPDSLSSAGEADHDASLSRLTSGRKRSDRPLDEALRRLVGASGSDLHVVPGAPPAFRIVGELAVAEDAAPFAADDLEKTLLALLPERSRRELEARGSALFGLDHPEVGRLRVRVTRERNGLGADIRRVAAAPPRAADLGLPPATARLFAGGPGLVLVAGPPGAGKTSTRAALFAATLAEKARVALLVEDPAEVVVPRGRGIVSTREVGAHASSLADALRAALAEDADLLAAPEPTDGETLALVLRLATRCLVALEVTAGSPGAAVDRLFDLVSGDHLERTRERLAGVLRGVLVQRLVPLSAGGRAAVFDLLLVTGAAAGLVRDGKTFQLGSLLASGKAQGMASANDGLADLVKKRAVPFSAALAASPDPAALKALLGLGEAAAAEAASS